MKPKITTLSRLPLLLPALLSVLLVLTGPTAAPAADGEVLGQQKISDTVGGFLGGLDDADRFGTAVAALGDLDGNSVTDLAVGAPSDDDGGPERGAVWILFLNSDGTVLGEQKISDTAGGFTGGLVDGDRFGASLADLGDRDGDGVTDLAVGAYKDDDGGPDRGAVWILFLNSDGTVKDHRKISDMAGGFTGGLEDTDHFGSAVVSPGDLDGDGLGDLAVGAYQSNLGGTERGAVWTLLLNSDLTVKNARQIGSAAGGFTGLLDDEDRFGVALAALGDLDGDAVPDLSVGAYRDDDGGTNRGAVWNLFLNDDGTVKTLQKISDTAGGFSGGLNDGDQIGSSLAGLGDLDGDGVADLASGAYQDGDGGSLRGASWVLFLDGIPDRLILADLTCVPASGTLPFSSRMTVTLSNTCTGQSRRVAATVDLTLASGTYFSNYRAGNTVIQPGDSRSFSWDQTLPALGTLVGDNRAGLVARDVTPAPWNQPPYPPSGDVESSSCTITGIAP